MAKTEIDLSALAQALSESISRTVLSFAGGENNAEENAVVENQQKTTKVPREKIKKTSNLKNEKPVQTGVKKVKVEDLNLDDEEDNSEKQEEPKSSVSPFSIQNSRPRRNLRPKSTWKSPDEDDTESTDRSVAIEDKDKKYCVKKPFEKKKRPNLFKDNLTEATADLYTSSGGKKKRVNKLYPPPVDRRPAEIERTYKCDYCGKKFKAFSSYVPHAVTGDSHPLIRCQRCSCK